MEEQQSQEQNDQPQKDSSPAQPVDASPDSASEVPNSQAPATPAPDEAERASGQASAEAPQSNDVSSQEDVAPDADEPGDDVAPEELAGEVQDSPDQPDEVDQEG